MTFTSRKPKSWGPYPALYQCMYVCCTARVQEDVALPDARLGLQQASLEQRLAHGLGELAVVAREAACQVGELRVVAAPLAHAVEALEDPAGGAGRGGGGAGGGGGRAGARRRRPRQPPRRAAR